MRQMISCFDVRNIRNFSFCFFSLFFFSVIFCSPVCSVDDIASQRAEMIWKQDSRIGLSRKQLVSACHFIEQIKKAPSTRRSIFKSSRTHLPCDIEWSSVLQGYLIKELPGHSPKIGKGTHKRVRKEIFYGRKTRVIADCLTDSSGAKEIAILKKLKGCRGIVPFLGAKKRPGNMYSIYLEYFSGGSLLKRVKRGHKFSTEQMLKIAKDVVRGMKSMHAKHLIHRDLHAGNILLRENQNGLFDAAIVDFGKSMPERRAGNSIVPQAARVRNPPETLLTPFSRLNRYSVDVYAMGCNFYLMMWRHPVPWGEVFNVYSLATYAPFFRDRMHKQIVSSYLKAKRNKIGRLLKKKRRGVVLNKEEEFQILIFRMIDFEPLRRPTASVVLKRLHQLAPKVP